MVGMALKWPVTRSATFQQARKSRTTVQGGCDGTSVDVERRFDSASWHNGRA